MRRFVLLLIVLLGGCHRTAAQRDSEREYGFVHMETTGLVSGIVIRSQHPSSDGPKRRPEVAIVFSDDSDRDALKALNDLGPSVLLPNADGDGITVVGTLDPTIRFTSTGPDKPTSEPYQEFRLSRWYLHAPFARYSSLMNLGEAPNVERDERLRSEDFGGHITGDLSRFVRAR